MIKIMPKLTGSDIVNKEVLRILSNAEGLTANEICDTFYIPYDSYYYYRDLTPLIKMDMDLKRKNELRNQAYKIATDVIDMYSILTTMRSIGKKLLSEEEKIKPSNRKIKNYQLELEKLNKRKWYVDSLVQYCNIKDDILLNIFIILEELYNERNKYK